MTVLIIKMFTNLLFKSSKLLSNNNTLTNTIYALSSGLNTAITVPHLSLRLFVFQDPKQPTRSTSSPKNMLSISLPNKEKSSQTLDTCSLRKSTTPKNKSSMKEWLSTFLHQ